MVKIFKQPSVIISGIAAYDRYFKIKGRFSDYLIARENISVGIPVDFVRRDFGGTGANIAYGLKKCGTEAMLLCRAGSDFGPYQAQLEKNKISYYAIADDNYFSPDCSIYEDSQENKISFFNNGALASTEKIDVGAMERKMNLAVIKYAIISANLAKNSLEFHAWAVKAGIKYIFDPGAKILDFNLTEFRKIDAGAFLTILNDQELDLFKKKHKKNLIKIGGAEYLIVTRGAGGLDVYRQGRRFLHKDIVKARRVVNTVGCGDALRGGLVGKLVMGGSLDRALASGLRLASLKAGTLGTQNF